MVMEVGGQAIHVGEKIFQNYRIETTNVGVQLDPVRDNAIYQLSEALLKIRDHEFPSK